MACQDPVNVASCKVPHPFPKQSIQANLPAVLLCASFSGLHFPVIKHGQSWGPFSAKHSGSQVASRCFQEPWKSLRPSLASLREMVFRARSYFWENPRGCYWMKLAFELLHTVKCCPPNVGEGLNGTKRQKQREPSLSCSTVELPLLPLVLKPLDSKWQVGG